MYVASYAYQLHMYIVTVQKLTIVKNWKILSMYVHAQVLNFSGTKSENSIE